MSGAEKKGMVSRMKTLKRGLVLLLAAVLMCGSAFAADSSFTDVSSHASYAGAVEWCVEQGIMNGVGNNRFHPNGVLTRATLAVVLYRAEGSPSVSGAPRFRDVTSGQWCADAVGWAAKEGVIQGYGDGTFGTNDPVTRVQLDVIIRRYKGENPSWPGDPAPKNATRAEVAAALYNALREEEGASRELSGKQLSVRFGDSDSFTLHLYNNQTADDIARHVGTADWDLPIYHYDDYDGWESFQYYDVNRRYDITDLGETVTAEKGGEVYYSHPNRIILFYQDAEITGEYTPVGYIPFSQALVDAVKNNPVVPGWGNKMVSISAD